MAEVKLSFVHMVLLLSLCGCCMHANPMARNRLAIACTRLWKGDIYTISIYNTLNETRRSWMKMKNIFIIFRDKKKKTAEGRR